MVDSEVPEYQLSIPEVIKAYVPSALESAPRMSRSDKGSLTASAGTTGQTTIPITMISGTTSTPATVSLASKSALRSSPSSPKHSSRRRRLAGTYKPLMAGMQRASTSSSVLALPRSVTFPTGPGLTSSRVSSTIPPSGLVVVCQTERRVSADMIGSPTTRSMSNARSAPSSVPEQQVCR